MQTGNTSGAAEKIEAGEGFWVGDHRIGRLDRWGDGDLVTLRATLESLVEQATGALDGISAVQQQRYDADTAARAGKYALQ